VQVVHPKQRWQSERHHFVTPSLAVFSRHYVTVPCMNILLTGASGFIGSHLAVGLRAAGHRVIETRREVRDSDSQVQVDFTRAIRVEDWIDKLVGVDCVINAVGILREHGPQSFETIHTQAPCALFKACAHSGVRRVIQISALGADHGKSGYFKSKHLADECLAQLDLEWTIVQPSVVYGLGGTSARLFSLLASLPITPLPGNGEQQLQPIHIDDLVEAVLAAIDDSNTHRRRVALVGVAPLALKDFLGRLRSSLGLKRAVTIGMPMPLMRLSAGIAQINPRSLLDRETLEMLEAGNIADPGQTTALLGRPPRAVETFIEQRYRTPLSHEALLQWLIPLMRFSIAAVWIWTGIVSLGVYPVEESYALLYRVGVSPTLAPLFLYGAAALDLAFGIGTIALPRRRLLYLLQIALILGYTIIITFKLPQFWLHPYGPILKNIPMVVGIVWLYCLERSDGVTK
jgi:uncharacterized protein YbjT (DUF2867 family)